jgi:diguanylate cyclase (GGDEF)-like protein
VQWLTRRGKPLQPDECPPRKNSPFAIIWIFAAIVLFLLVLADFSLGLLSSMRAYVGAESLWSKSQKDAVFHLQQYAANGAPEDLRRFHAEIDVLMGDHEARIEMNKPNPDFEVVRQGFVRGGVHGDDVRGMFMVYRSFERNEFMQRATRAWASADGYMVQLNDEGTRLQHEIESGSPEAPRIQSILADVLVVNEELTPVEKQFVDALSDASRMTYRVLRAIMFGATPGLLLFGIVMTLRILRHRKLTEDRVNHIAFHDDLTSLPNRLLLNQTLDRALSLHSRSSTRLAVLSLGVDRFKVINDSLGRALGDALLQQIAVRLRRYSRAGTIVARMGGDEFVALLENQEDVMSVASCAQRLAEQLGAPYLLGGKDCHLTISIGISIFPSDGTDSQTLLKAADVAMYRAKETGRNNCQSYSPTMNVHTADGLELESDLRHALQRDEFLLYYQPKVDIRTGLITGVEALLRWKHPRRGLVAPSQFIPLAEETGLIVPMGEWVLATACARIKSWQDLGLAQLSVAVNLSARQFADPLLVSRLTQIIRASGLDPSHLELEITESVAMSNGELTVVALEKLKALGVKIAIDDFGTGYSSLSYLKRFPIDTLKIDRSFIRDIPMDSGDKKITRAIIAMAHSFKLTVVAEGVETAEQLAFLRTQRCDVAQGFFLYRPLAEGEVAGALQLNRLDHGVGAPQGVA